MKRLIRKSDMGLCVRVAAWMAALVCLAAPVSAKEIIPAAVLRVDYERLLPVSRLDLPAEDQGFAGGILARDDNMTTGQFTGHEYTVDTIAAVPDTAVDALKELEAAGHNFIAVLAEREELLAMSAAASADTLIINALAPDNDLRSGACAPNMLHVVPSRRMRTDALGQFLIWKNWTDWVLLSGSNPNDIALADNYRQTAAKFGARIVEERVIEDEGGARRTDTGHVLVQRQLPVLTQDFEDHDVVVAADESDYYAIYLPYHIWTPAPVTGSAGLMPLSWHPANEAWGATQVQRRFEKLAGRRMTEDDYHAWMALRVLGEVVTRIGKSDKTAIVDYVLSEDFEMAAFKGQAATFRPWNGQLRQSILLGDGRIMVSVSPQDGFLHQHTTLDTMGLDEPESECTAFQ